MSDDNDIMDMDFSEVEMRVLAHMREDAEKMDDTDSYRRPDDLAVYDTMKVRTLLSLSDAESILKGEGVVDLPDFHKSNAAEIFECEHGEVTKEMRDFAKSYTLMEYYGATVEMVQERVDVAVAAARRKLNES